MPFPIFPSGRLESPRAGRLDGEAELTYHAFGKSYIFQQKVLKRMMRPSCYLNIIDTGDGQALLYNGLSMCVDVVPAEIARGFATLEAGAQPTFLRPAEEQHLLRRGHLTRLSVSCEHEEMRKLALALAAREATRNAGPSGSRTLSFILTYSCNLACSYCFQNGLGEAPRHSPAMDEAFVDAFFQRHLDRLFPVTPKDRLRFILFGGEPMLPGNRRTIERILGYAGQHGIFVSTATNGILLPRMLDLIGPGAGKIQGVQVTLDGDQAFHDRLRRAPSGAPTFAATLGSIRQVIQAGAMAFVRVHLHPGGLESTARLVEHLGQEGILGHPQVEVYFAPVHSFHAETISPPELELFSRLFQQVALRQKALPIQNFDHLGQFMEIDSLKEWSQPHYCSVSAGTHYAVDPHGDLYECLEEAGDKDRRCGSLTEGGIECYDLQAAYRQRHLEHRPECLECSIALFCGGGCISQKRTQGGSATQQFCRQNQFFVGQALKACHLRKHQTGRA